MFLHAKDSLPFTFSGRGKKGGMKMASTMMKMIMNGKGMMIPMMLEKFMGMKGLFMDMISMVMMKIMFLSKLKGNGGMKLGCASGGGGGGGGCGGSLWPMMGMGGGGD
jgi:hypothetical protein